MRKRPLSVVAAAGIWAVAMMPATARAQNAAASQDAIAELKQQVRALEAKIEKLESMNQKVQIIDRKLELDEQAQKDRQFSMPAVQANAEGFYLKDPEDRYKLHIGGWIQADSRWFTSQEPAPQSSTFVMRRVRPYFEGTLAEYYDFRLLLDFGQGTATLQDAWADMHYWDEFRLRMGKMKAPTGIERR